MSTRSLPTPRSEKPETIPYLSLELWGVIDASIIDVSRSPKELLLGAAALRCCSKEHHVGLPSLALPDDFYDWYDDDQGGWLGEYYEDFKPGMSGVCENAHPAVFARVELATGGSLEAIELAAKHGRLDVVQWLYPSAISESHRRCRFLIKVDAMCGQLEIVQWLRAQEPPCPWDAGAVQFAAAYGHLEVLQWLRAQEPPCPWDRRAVARAEEEGHLEIVQWLCEQNAPNSHSHRRSPPPQAS